MTRLLESRAMRIARRSDDAGMHRFAALIWVLAAVVIAIILAIVIGWAAARYGR